MNNGFVRRHVLQASGTVMAVYDLTSFAERTKETVTDITPKDLEETEHQWDACPITF
jgi:hypothetical protein